ncbi:type II toxin-antitoxin system RelE family toxin [Catalinimonas niigatensis]
MKSVTTERFRKAFSKLPERIQDSARSTYQMWKQNPHHSALQFKQVHQTQSIFSVRIGLSYRALGIKDKETVIWFWIGSHEEYNKLIKQI